jgi:hypothetical protein
MPAAGPVAGHPERLDAVRNGAGPAEPDPPHLRHPHLADAAGHPAHLPLPAAAPDDPETLVPPGLAPGRPPGRVVRVEERGHRPGEVPQRLLLDRLRARRQPPMLFACGGELPALGQVARSARPARPPVGVLLDGQVPHIPGVGAVLPQHRLLGAGGVQPVPGHANTLATATDIPEEVKRRFLPGPKTGAFTPRS